MFGMLFLAADFAYDESAGNRPKDRQCGAAILQRILEEARNKGFEHGAILETMLARYDVSSRTHLLVYRLIYLVGEIKFMKIYESTIKEFYPLHRKTPSFRTEI